MARKLRVKISRRLGGETTMTLEWIAARLHMVAAGCAVR
jgi:hypothetical protein